MAKCYVRVSVSEETRDRALARLQAAVDGVLVAVVDGERGLEGFLRNLPHGFVVGVGVAVGHEQAVEEFEQVARHAERAEGVDQPLVRDRVVEQRAERAAVCRSAPQLRMRALARSYRAWPVHSSDGTMFCLSSRARW